jgi:tetratricopeptide (TPR) repeat protein
MQRYPGAEYKKAIELESAFTLTYVNPADLYRLRGEEEKGERVLNEALNEALKKHTYNRDFLVALATIQRDRGKRAEALRYAETLMRLWPQDQSYKRLYQELSGGPGR